MNGIPRLTYQQYRAVRRLVHDCCNYDGGNCLALDDGWEPCVCVQSITYSLVCKGFRARRPANRQGVVCRLAPPRTGAALCRVRGDVRAALQSGQIL